MSALRSTILRSFSWLAGGQLVRLGLGFLVSLALIRYLGPERFGIYSYVIALAGLFASLPKLGIHQILLRDLARAEGRIGEDLGTAFVLKLLGGFASLVLASLAAWWTDPDDTTVRLGVALVAGANLFYALEVVETWHLARDHPGPVTRARTVVTAAVSAVKLGLIALGAPVGAFFAAVALDAALLAAAFAWLYGGTGQSLRAWRFSRPRALAFLAQGWPMIISAAALMVQARVDQVMIGDLLGRAAVGQYAAGLRLLDAMAFLPVALQLAFAPTLARAKQGGPASYRAAMLDFYRAMLLPTLAIIVGLVLFGDTIVVRLFGPDYQQAGALLGFFSLRLFFSAQGLARAVFITNEGLFRFAMGTALVGALVNVGLNLVWIPSHGLDGAVSASLVSFSVSAVLLDAFHPKARAHVATLVRVFVPRRSPRS